MRGCLVKRGKSEVWWGKIYIDGQQKWFRLGSVNKHEAHRQLREEIGKRERSFHNGTRKMIFSELAQLWLDSKKIDLKPSTIDFYERRIKVQLLPFFGERLVNKIHPEHIESFKNKLAEKLSSKTINHALTVLYSVIDAGVRWGYLLENPVRFVSRLKQRRKQFNALTREEVSRLLDAVEGQDKALLMTAITGGLRMGEILSMTWDNLNWDDGTYTVKTSYSSFGVDTPKTEASFRSAQFTPALMQMLRDHRKEQLSRPKSLQCQDNGLVFPTEAGTHMNASNLRNRVFYPALKKAGLHKRLRFHDLRGTCATLLLEAGADIKSVQDQLGHRTAKMTLEVYAKVNPAAKKEASRKLEAYLLG